jgi:hypothetical protein
MARNKCVINKSGKLINTISKDEKGNPNNIGKVTWIIMAK